MNKWQGHLRVATTRGKVPDPKVESQVTILREGPRGLARVGALEHLARGEDLRAIRFDDERGYLVTFKKTDPLFVVDLANAASPRVLGELKSQAFPRTCTACHGIACSRWASTRTTTATTRRSTGSCCSYYDVTNPTTPKLLHRAKIGTRGSSSAAATDHLAFNYLSERGLLALPVTQCERGGDGAAGTEVAFTGL